MTPRAAAVTGWPGALQADLSPEFFGLVWSGLVRPLVMQGEAWQLVELMAPPANRSGDRIHHQLDRKNKQGGVNEYEVCARGNDPHQPHTGEGSGYGNRHQQQ
jgi:hypothetical protein